MNAFMDFLTGKMELPKSYGWFHLLMTGIIILTTVFICLAFRKATDKQTRWILFSISMICVIFEIYKQLVYSYNGGEWKYSWHIFPFQFCSTPMYVALIASFLKDCKVRRGLFAFLSTYGLFAGLSVMVYPDGVWSSYIGINIQTMVHHGLQITLGIFLLISNNVKINFKSMLGAFLVFLTLVMIALGLNLLTHALGLKETFNMFFISPYFDCPLVVLSTIYANVPYLLFLLIYILGFTICGGIMLLFAKLIEILTYKIKAKEKIEMEK